MDTWDWHIIEAEVDARIEGLLGPFIFFFKKDKELYGAGEDSRVIFAKMKNPDDDLPSGWSDEANFSAHNLLKMIKGEPAQHLFNSDDLKQIKIVDKEKVSERLRKEVEKLGEKAFPQQKRTLSLIDLTRFFRKGSDEAPNFVRADEE